MRSSSIHKRLEHLESLRRHAAGAPRGAQPQVTAAISEYLESLREWRRSAPPEEPGGLVPGEPPEEESARPEPAGD